MRNEAPDANTTNEVSGHSGNVVQAGVINGGVVMRQECAHPLLAYVEAGAALDSRSPVREASALAALVILLSVNNEMFGAVVDLVRAWCTAVEPAQARVRAATRLMFTALPYSLAEPDLQRRRLMGELIATVLSFRGGGSPFRYRFIGLHGRQEELDGLAILIERQPSRRSLLTVTTRVPF